MIIKHRIYFVILFCCCVFSVQAQKLYYYHRGDSVSLSVNSQHFLVYAEAGKISMDELNREFKITESIETGQNGVLEVPAISNHNSQFTHHKKMYFRQINS